MLFKKKNYKENEKKKNNFCHIINIIYLKEKDRKKNAFLISESASHC